MAMRDVIQKMLVAEAEAKRIVAQAEGEAERTRAEARRQAQQLADQVRDETRAEVDAAIEEAVQQADRERQQRLAKAAGNIEADLRLDEKRQADAVEVVVRCVRGR